MVYTLYLASAQGNQDLGSTSSQQISWNINWDSLFRNENNKECRVKFHFLYNEIEDDSSIDQQFSPNTRQFYLSANFSSNTQTSNKSNLNTSGIQGVILGLVNGKLVETPDIVSGSTTLRRQLGLEGYTLNSDGVSIIKPEGIQRFTLYLIPSAPTSFSFNRAWNIILQFIFDEDDL